MREVNTYELEILEQTPDRYELRLLIDGGVSRTRTVDRAVVDDLLATAEHVYGPRSITWRVFGSPQLQDLGTRLLTFIEGEEPWLASLIDGSYGATLRIITGHRLQQLPWELLARDGSFLTVDGRAPLLTVRAAGAHTVLPDPVVPGNRPLRVLFMATSPEGVEPVLNFEAEESAILQATARTGTDLVVEESGTLEGLRFLNLDYGNGYFDVLHLTGHATVTDGRPVFLIENELGEPILATADQLAQAMEGNWPRLVFISGCLTGKAFDDDASVSMGQSIVRAGAPVVLGWALPVGDNSATELAAELYRALAAGQPVDRAIVEARQHLFMQKHSAWHQLRVYADRSPFTPLVTPLRTRGRAQTRIRFAELEFLDPRTQMSRVATRSEFIGRRRVIQRCLRTLRSGPEGHQALVLHGMSGLGKSSLASRLLERMPTHQRVVWYGRVDLTRFRELTTKVDFATMDEQIDATRLLDTEQVSLTIRLRYLLNYDGPLGRTPCLFVFDDFEEGNLESSDGVHVLTPEMAEILPALLQAIRDTGSPSRVIITSRYRFPAPPGTSVRVESLETLTQVEQAKKLERLRNLSPSSHLDPRIRERAIEAAAGNPRLLDWLDRVLDDTALDADDLITAIENEADRFRESVLARKLIDSQPRDLQRMLAKVDVAELPVPGATVRAIHDHPDVEQHIERAVRLGLLEEGIDPITRVPRYFVSNVLRPLIRPLITDEEYRETCAAAARSLHNLWVIDPAAAPIDRWPRGSS